MLDEVFWWIMVGIWLQKTFATVDGTAIKLQRLLTHISLQIYYFNN